MDNNVATVQNKKDNTLPLLLITAICLANSVGLFLLNSNTTAPPPELAGELIGTVGAGLLWGLLWSWLWGKGYKILVAVVLTVYMFVSIGPGLINRQQKPVATPQVSIKEASITGCTSTCTGSLTSSKDTPGSPLKGFQEADVQNLCRCACQTTISSLNEAQMNEVSAAKSKEDIPPAITALLQTNLRICYKDIAKHRATDHAVAVDKKH